MYHSERLQRDRPLLGYTLEEVLTSWKRICDELATSSQRIHAFVGCREFHWHQGKLMRVLAEQHLKDASDEEIADLHRAILLGSFLVIQHTNVEDEPVILHQPGDPLPLLPLKLWEEETPPIQRSLPIIYRMLLAVPHWLRRLSMRIIIHLVSREGSYKILQGRLARTLMLLIPAISVGVINLHFTHNIALSCIFAEITVPLAAIIIHRITTGTWGISRLAEKAHHS
jgi:hypothetical protein